MNGPSILAVQAHFGDRHFGREETFMQTMPFLADYIWIGGGTLGLILVVLVVVLLLRK